MIRKANLNDVDKCVKLLRLALDDIAYHLSGTKDEIKTDERLSFLFKEKQSRISYENIIAYEKDGVIAGMMTSYDGSRLAWLDEIYGGVFETECFDDEYYIDAIAVFHEFRGQGIATELLKYAEILGKNMGKISLIVDVNKTKNILLYEKLGFKTDQILRVYGHEFKHMIKEVR